MFQVVFDTETTGLPNADAAPIETQPRIIEFAAVKLDEKFKEVGRLEFICNPEIEINDIIRRITGLTTNDVCDKPLFSAFLKPLVEFFLGVEKVYAHNLAFDLSMMKFELIRLGKVTAFPWPPVQICTVEKSMSIRGHRLNMQKLHNLATGKDHIEGAHRAMVDVMALVECVKWLNKEGFLK